MTGANPLLPLLCLLVSTGIPAVPRLVPLPGNKHFPRCRGGCTHEVPAPMRCRAGLCVRAQRSGGGCQGGPPRCSRCSHVLTSLVKLLHCPGPLPVAARELQWSRPVLRARFRPCFLPPINSAMHLPPGAGPAFPSSFLRGRQMPSSQ